MSTPVAPDDIVQTPAEGEANSRPPLLILRPLEAFLDAHGIGEGEITGQPDRGRALQRHLPDRARRQRGRPASPAPWAAAAERPRRAPRGAPAEGLGRHPGAGSEGSGGGLGRVHDRGPLLRDGAGPRRGDRGERPRAAGLPTRAQTDRRAADRVAGGDPLGRLARRRAGGLRQTHRLPRTPAAPLQRPLGAQQDARDRGRRERRRRGWPRTCPTAARPRSSTATTGSGTRCSPPSPPPAWRRSSTGRWPRSATRWPTSATCA